MVPSCHGYGRIYDWMKEELPASGDWWKLLMGKFVLHVLGERLNPIGRNVFLQDKNKRASFSYLNYLPSSPEEISGFLENLQVQKANYPF
jgi:hypothetical protein